MKADDINQRAAEIRAQQLHQARAAQEGATAQERKKEEQRRELQSRMNEINQLAIKFYRWVTHYEILTDTLPRYSSWKSMVPSRKVGWHLVVKVIHHPPDGGKMLGYDETSYLVVTIRGELVVTSQAPC
jgi:predicted RNase H-like nuclease (RuvC/YqgF family)